jgi:hypothetical protein
MIKLIPKTRLRHLREQHDPRKRRSAADGKLDDHRRQRSG